MLALLLQPPDSNLAPQVTRGSAFVRSENLLWRSMPHLSWLILVGAGGLCMNSCFQRCLMPLQPNLQ
ncbi:hypothetical protein SORBI_3004G221200 [Sorghum bicolor]|uniref:Uncharacterized protein n=1 Tax=Sorghum bicolor TaxID=4558 RepID=A0A194YR12_SORBI|nr:hypothetical protein SORBI_3004G221200 [Sorghum bicolor]